MEIVHTAEVETTIGLCCLATTERGLAYLQLPRESGRGLRGWLRLRAPESKTLEAFAPNRIAIRQLLEYLEGKRTKFDIPLDLRGTPFQLSVWSALLEIPYGETRSYAEQAAKVGRP